MLEGIDICLLTWRHVSSVGGSTSAQGTFPVPAGGSTRAHGVCDSQVAPWKNVSAQVNAKVANCTDVKWL